MNNSPIINFLKTKAISNKDFLVSRLIKSCSFVLIYSIFSKIGFINLSNKNFPTNVYSWNSVIFGNLFLNKRYINLHITLIECGIIILFSKLFKNSWRNWIINWYPLL